MFQALKNMSIRRAFRTSFALLIVAVLCFFAGGNGVLTLLRGPVELSGLPVDEIDGKYVSMTVETVLQDYAYTADGDNVDSTEYMVSVLLPEGEYLMGVLVDQLDASTLESKMNDLINYEYWEPDPEMSFTVTGTVQPMDSESRQFFSETLDSWEIDRNYAAYSILHVNSVGGRSVAGTVAFGVACAAIILWMLIILIRAFTGGYQNKIRKQISQNPNPEGFREELEEWFPTAEKIGAIYFGQQYVVLQHGIGHVLVSPGELVWAYRQTQRTNGIATSHNLMLGVMNQKIHTVAMRKKYVIQALDFIAVQYPWVALGYEREFRKMFKKDPASLRQVADAQHAPVPDLSPEQSVV